VSTIRNSDIEIQYSWIVVQGKFRGKPCAYNQELDGAPDLTNFMLTQFASTAADASITDAVNSWMGEACEILLYCPLSLFLLTDHIFSLQPSTIVSISSTPK
jgi:hypothetical protein